MLVEMRGITKRFGALVANSSVDFDVAAGEVHALLGENGAGKSTLMSLLAGFYRPDSGEIRLLGNPQAFTSPRDAMRAGVGMVHQHFKLVPTFTVTENIMLGMGRGRVDWRAMEAKVAELSRTYGLQVDPSAYVWQLSIGEQQRVEILKVLLRGARVLVLDEPTAVLTPQEAEALFSTCREMARLGHGVVLITHKMREVLAVADRITVLRQGRNAGTVIPSSVDERALATLMVGRDVPLVLEKEPVTPGPVLLNVQDLSAPGDRGRPALSGVSFTLAAGEILGVAGVSGNGQRELTEVLAGLQRASSGRVSLHGEDVTRWSPRQRSQAGLAFVPEDRLGMGLVPGLDMADNVILRDYDRAPVGRGWRVDRRQALARARELVSRFDVRGGAVDRKVGVLSGGNAQKLLLARELHGNPRVVLAVHPVRGLDVAATRAVHRLLLDARQDGKAILLVSEDLDELLELSDRILVLYEGRVMGIVPAEPGRRTEIGWMMAGRSAAAHAAAESAAHESAAEEAGA